MPCKIEGRAGAARGYCLILILGDSILVEPFATI